MLLQLTLRQISPEGPFPEIPHWAKLPKKYEQLKKKIAQLKRQWKQAEKHQQGHHLYKVVFV